MLELLVVDIELSDGKDGIPAEVVLLNVLAWPEESEVLKMPPEVDRLIIVANVVLLGPEVEPLANAEVDATFEVVASKGEYEGLIAALVTALETPGSSESIWKLVSTGGCKTAALKKNAKIKQQVERCIVRRIDHLVLSFLPG